MESYLTCLNLSELLDVLTVVKNVSHMDRDADVMAEEQGDPPPAGWLRKKKNQKATGIALPEFH